MQKVSVVTQQRHAIRVPVDRVRKQVGEKFKRWMKQKRAQFVPFVPDKVDWRLMALNAVWRNPPFVADPKQPEFEKGFRDALIME